MSTRRRGYRSMQADAEQGMVTCPRCHEIFAPLEGGRPAVQSLPGFPDGFPVRTPAERAARIEKLQPHAHRLRAELRGRVAESTFRLWLAPVQLVDAAGDTLYVIAPDEIAVWVRDRFGRVLEQAATALARRPIKVVVAAGGAS